MPPLRPPPTPAARFPRPPQELGLRNAWVSETIFWCMFIPFIFWSFSPFVTARKRFYTAVLYARLLMVLVGEPRWACVLAGWRLAAGRVGGALRAAETRCGGAGARVAGAASKPACAQPQPLRSLAAAAACCAPAHPRSATAPPVARPVACQILRIISFTVTQLPAPNYHCRLGRDTAVRAPAEHWWNHVVVDVGRQATHGCGDLIFSSHTTFVLTGVLTFTEYGETLAIKVSGWKCVRRCSGCRCPG